MSHAASDTVSGALARNRLGAVAVMFIVLAAAAPLTVVGAGVAIAFAVLGVIGIPVAYLVVAVVLALFAVGFVAMSRRIVNAGAFYTYVTHGLGRPAGVAAAMVALLAYSAMQCALYGGVGLILASFVGGPFAWWAYALLVWMLIAVLGQLRVDVNGRILAVLLLAEIAILIIYNAVMLTHPADGQISFAALSPSHIVTAGFGAALVAAITGFVGFEGTVVFAEESKDPRRTVARATYAALTVTGVLYAVSAWAMTVATGPDNIVEAARSTDTDLIFALVAPHVAAIFVIVGLTLIITSLIAAAGSFHNTLTRYGYALGRERVLPAMFQRTNTTTGAPWVSSLAQSGLALCVIVVVAMVSDDPMLHLFFWGATIGGAGVLILMTVTSYAVVSFFARHRREETLWRARIAPVIASIVLTGILAATLADFDVLLGVAPDSPLRWVFPGAYGVAALVGVVWAMVLRATKPDIYATIGRGANVDTRRTASPSPVTQPV